MFVVGIVTLNEDEVGTFELDEEEKLTIKFNRGAAGVRETLEFAAENGINFGLQLKPEYGRTV